MVPAGPVFRSTFGQPGVYMSPMSVGLVLAALETYQSASQYQIHDGVHQKGLEIKWLPIGSNSTG